MTDAAETSLAPKRAGIVWGLGGSVAALRAVEKG
jgi:hypothetical protein